MVEGIHRVQQAQLRTSMSIAIRVLAQQHAIKAVKHQLRGRGQGFTPSSIEISSQWRGTTSSRILS